MDSACKSSGFQRFKQFLTRGFYDSPSASSSEESSKRSSASSLDSCHSWGFDSEELKKMWNGLHGYDGMHYAIRVIKDYDDFSHAYTWELRGHLEEWVKKNSVFPIEHGVNCGSMCLRCNKISCLGCQGDVVWVDHLDEWQFFCKTCKRNVQEEEDRKKCKSQ
jgi:hypothetical protein